MGPFKPQVIVGLDFANSFLLREDRTRCSTKTDAKRDKPRLSGTQKRRNPKNSWAKPLEYNRFLLRAQTA